MAGRRPRWIEDLAERGIRDPAVLAALARVPRGRFVDEALSAGAHADAALPIGARQSISQPWIVARMTELAGPDPRARVLEIGTGSGYQSAILSQVFELVYTVERLEHLSRRARATLRALRIENVHLKVFDGGYGWSEFAPYDAIVVTAAVPELPAPLVDQLADGGRLVAPLARPGSRPDDEQTLVRLVQRAGRVTREEHGSCRFVPLHGRYGFRARP